ncbi:hypothetical protein AbraIFM66950_007324 [Aspergillus brasiliensis]|nr:hypothetical protein AbraIFM66950_007324 [Aspergillus brasiliensis]
MEMMPDKLERQIKAPISTSCDKHERKTLNMKLEKQVCLAKSEYEFQREEERFRKRTLSRPAEVNILPEKVPPTFNISPDTTGRKRKFSSSELLPIPPGLEKILNDIDIVAEHSANGIVQRRARLDAILFNTLATAKGSSSADESVQSVCLHTDIYMKMPWESKKGLQLLWGRPDYSLWYGEPGKMETNLVVCAAKELGGIREYQVLTYMAMIHHARRMAGREDTSVCGIATDTFHWAFLRLYNDSKYSVHTYFWDQGQQLEVIANLRRIIDHAGGLARSLKSDSSFEKLSGLEFVAP